jgi:hypothetical protein
MAIVAALLAGYGGASYAATDVASGGAGPTDTEPTPEPTTPAPDPAPAAKPAPKPAPKPSTTPTSRPATLYHAPVAPAPRATYTPTRLTPRTKPVSHKQHKRHPRAKHVSSAPKPQGGVKDASVVRIGVVPTAAVATEQSNALRRTLVIAGIGFAALLFLLVVTVPATGIRFTGPGRVVMDHQTDIVITGIATLLLTALLFAITGSGS